MKVLLVLFAQFLILFNVFSQEGKNTYIAEMIIDDEYGITQYEPLNMMIGADSVRNGKNGYAANGFIEDYYTTGQRLHKGFYVDGQLKVYKNYYPNENVERNFRMVDTKKSKMTLFYKNGTMKSNIVYVGDQALKWEDYYKNGVLAFLEEYDKSFQYLIKKETNYENGNPESLLELVNKKKLLYFQTNYYSSGEVEEEGELKYNVTKYDYEKIGSWILFNRNGEPTKEQKFIDGKLHSEEDF